MAQLGSLLNNAAHKPHRAPAILSTEAERTGISKQPLH
jgi:hypothetical protein